MVRVRVSGLCMNNSHEQSLLGHNRNESPILPILYFLKQLILVMESTCDALVVSKVIFHTLLACDCTNKNQP